MSFNSLSLTEKVLTRIPVDLDREQETFLRYAIAQWIEDALFRLARNVSDATDRATRQLLQRDYTLAISSGVGLLANAQYQGVTVVTEPFFYDRIDPSTLKMPGASSYKFQVVEHPSVLDLNRPRVFIYYCVFDGQILTRNTDGSTNSLTGTLNFAASYLPLLPSVPGQLESRLVDELTGIATEKLGEKSFIERALENQGNLAAEKAQESQERMQRLSGRGVQSLPPQQSPIPNPDSTRGVNVG